MQKIAAAVVLSSALLTGCGTSSDTVVVTPNSVFVIDDAQAVAWEGGLFWSVGYVIDPTGVVDVNAAAADAATKITAFFTPSSCVTASANANVLTVQLSDCTAPFGFSNASGTITFTLTQPQVGTVQLAASSNNLSSSMGAVLTVDAQAVLAASGSSRTLTVSTNGDGTGPGGSTVTRQGQYTITWMVNDTCASISGSVSTGTAIAETTSFRSFNVCKDGCPRSGSVTLTDPQTGATVTTTYDGTATVTVNAAGQQSTTTLDCN